MLTVIRPWFGVPKKINGFWMIAPISLFLVTRCSTWIHMVWCDWWLCVRFPLCLLVQKGFTDPLCCSLNINISLQYFRTELMDISLVLKLYSLCLSLSTTRCHVRPTIALLQNLVSLTAYIVFLVWNKTVKSDISECCDSIHNRLKYKRCDENNINTQRTHAFSVK